MGVAATSDANLKSTNGEPEATGLTTEGLDRGERLVRPRLHPRTNYTWPFAAGPTYGGTASTEPGTLRTWVGNFDLTSNDLGLPQELMAADDVQIRGLQYYILQMHPEALGNGSFSSLRASIEAAGGTILEPMRVAAFVTRMTPEARALADSAPGVIAVTPYHPAFKLNPSIGQIELPDVAKAQSDVYDLELQLHRGEDSALVASALAQLGGNILHVARDSVRLEIHRDKLAAVAGIPAVFLVFEHVPVNTMGEETTVTMQVGRWCPSGACPERGPQPYRDEGVDGRSNVIMVIDSGISLDSGDLSDTKVNAGSAGVGHRKVVVYQSTSAFGGGGDLLSCDSSANGGFTHGQVVSATALGWASQIDAAYDPGMVGFEVTDDNNEVWEVDGVAPRARLIFYDAQTIPTSGLCTDPFNDGLAIGDLYDGVTGSASNSSLGESYNPFDEGDGGLANGARISNFSFGGGENVYTGGSLDIDNFMNDQRDAVVFISAGNEGSDDDSDNIPDVNNVTAPATCKNCVAVGATRNTSDITAGNTGSASPNSRAFFSSVGPVGVDCAGVPSGCIGRIQPILMAPGDDFPGNQGIDSEFTCKSTDNDQNNSVECALSSSSSGTSFAAPAAAGAAAVVRSYFGEGFYPDGSGSNPSNAAEQIPNISGALLKSVLIASADWVGGGNAIGINNTIGYRMNREQGYGRITLDNALPLQTWGRSPVGLIVADGDLAGGPNNTTLDGTISTGQGVTPDETQFDLCDDASELRIALSWTESANGGDLVNDLDLVLIAPDATEYWGNYFTDDNDRNGSVAGGEDCPAIDGANNGTTPDSSPWSLPTCGNSIRDTFNPSEAIFLSPDADADGDDDADFNQIQAGQWTLRVQAGAGGVSTNQNYAVTITGGVCLGSSVRFNQGAYVCNDDATVIVNETDEIDDPAVGLTAGEIASRTTVEVIVDGMVVDTEIGLSFVKDPDLLRYTAENVVLTDGTAFDPGNGALDIADGATLRVTYQDESTDGGVNPDDLKRVSESTVDCSVSLGFGRIIFNQFGRNSVTILDGGCERDARGGFEFGFPDKYVDAGEIVGLGIAFSSDEVIALEDVDATLRCVVADANSPEDCQIGDPVDPGVCDDPDRLDNADCSGIMTILDPIKPIGDIPAGALIGVHFTLQADMAAGAAPQELELLLGLEVPKSGKGVPVLNATRITVNADERSFFYSTDFPTGGTETRDVGDEAGSTLNDEIVDNPTSNLGDFLTDYRFEERTWSDLTAGGGRNQNKRIPWNFNTNNGGILTGLGAITVEPNDVGEILSYWGEDKDFDDTLDAGEDRDPTGDGLTQNWSTRGGCGWQTTAGGNGGVWHTGDIRGTSGQGANTCLADGDASGRCQTYEIFLQANRGLFWYEVALLPTLEKVNNTDDFTIEHMNVGWNASVRLEDPFALIAWEPDIDAADTVNQDVLADGTVYNIVSGDFGAPNGDESAAAVSRPHLFGSTSTGFPVFGRYTGGLNNQNGTVGNNRVGEDNCFFETAAIAAPGTAGPPDDDVNNDGDGSTDETVLVNGPIRNTDLTAFNGLDLRFNTMEDSFNDAGDTFQLALGFAMNEDPDPLTGDPPLTGFGWTVDDVVWQWREYDLITDATDCATGRCATIDLATTNFYEGSGLIDITLIEFSPPADNDCDGDGNPDGTTDCDGDGARDVVVEVFSDNRNDVEFTALNETTMGGAVFTGSLPVSVKFDTDGVLFLQRNGTDLPSVNVEYFDADDGTGSVCANDIDPAAEGIVATGTAVFIPVGRLTLETVRLDDNGDNDGIADRNETIDMFITLNNNSGADLEDIVASITTASPNVECITQGSIAFGNLVDGASAESVDAFRFRVSNAADRAGAFDLLTAEFTLSLSSDLFDATFAPQPIILDLDLDITDGGGSPDPFFENFDAGFGEFTSMALDAGTSGSNASSDTFRCQYNDPDYINSNSYGFDGCFLGDVFPPPIGEGNITFDWHIHDGTAPDGGRGTSGSASLHYGRHPSGDPLDDTYSLAQIDAVRMINPVHLARSTELAPVKSVLSFNQQVSLFDFRVGIPGGESFDRAVAMVQLANAAGTGQGDWLKIRPYRNVYDAQGTDAFVNCLFDPTDDGNDEDDFFDPTDPDRRLGPSSTCYPEFAWAFLGDTDHRAAFNPVNTGLASDPDDAVPGSDATEGGTWMGTEIDLSRFQGQSLRLRFLMSTGQLQPGTILASDALSGDTSGFTGENGWYIDDVAVTNTVDLPNTTNVEPDAGPGLNECATNCGSLTAELEASNPADDGNVFCQNGGVGDCSTSAPGKVLNLSAVNSFADVCVDGTLQYRFWVDGNNNDVLGDVEDTLLRDWTDNAFYTDAPSASTNYATEVRCSSAPSCGGADVAVQFLFITVNCPSSGNLGFNQVVTADASKADYSWSVAATVDVIQGDLDALRSGGTFTGTVNSCLADDSNISTFNDATNPAVGSGLYYLVKGSSGGAACNELSTWSSNGPAEQAGRDAQIDADGNTCP